MNKIVVGHFRSIDDAEKAASLIKNSSYNLSDIKIVPKSFDYIANNTSGQSPTLNTPVFFGVSNFFSSTTNNIGVPFVADVANDYDKHIKNGKCVLSTTVGESDIALVETIILNCSGYKVKNKEAKSELN